MTYVDGFVAAVPTTNQAMPKVMADPRLKPDTNPKPFDAKPLIYGGLETIVEV